MFEYLLSYTLSCTDAKEIIARAKSVDLDEAVVAEVIETIKDNTDSGCDWDAND